jgi:hypothetical protein
MRDEASSEDGLLRKQKPETQNTKAKKVFKSEYFLL